MVRSDHQSETPPLPLYPFNDDQISMPPVGHIEEDQSAIEKATSEWQEKHALAQKVTMEEVRLEGKEKAGLPKCVSLQQELFRVSLDAKSARLSAEEMQLVVTAKAELQKLVC